MQKEILQEKIKENYGKIALNGTLFLLWPTWMKPILMMVAKSSV